MQWQGLQLHNDICEVHRRVTVYAYFLQYTSLYPKFVSYDRKLIAVKKVLISFSLVVDIMFPMLKTHKSSPLFLQALH